MHLSLKKNFYNRFFSIFYFIVVSNIFTAGTIFFKYSYFITLLSLLLFFNYKKINKKIVIINFICIFIILYFKKIDTISIAIIFFLIFGLFKYELKNNFNFNNRISKKSEILFGCIIFVLIILNLSPSTKHFHVKLTEDLIKKTYEVDVDPSKATLLVRKDENNHIIPFKSSLLNDSCIKKNSSNINTSCYKKTSLYLLNRLSINNLDPNFFSCLIFFFTIFYFQSKKKKIGILDYILISSIFLVLLFMTKSRTLVVYGLVFILLYSNLKEKKFSFLNLFFIMNFLVFLFSLIYYNFYQLYPVNINTDGNAIIRLIDLNDHAITIRFFNILNSLNFQLTNLDKIIFPGSDIIFKEKYMINSNIYNNYNPHNFLLSMIKDYGIMVTFIVIFNLSNFFKKFNSTNFLSLIIACSFFGYSLIFLFTFILFQNIKNSYVS